MDKPGRATLGDAEDDDAMEDDDEDDADDEDEDVGYAALDAPLYPAPQPFAPLHVGGTVVTNPALDPHEMLYPHTYRGLYPPFYHKTTRSWIMTPLGIYKTERRVLTGTEVKVKYKPHIAPWSMFFPPVR